MVVVVVPEPAIGPHPRDAIVIEQWFGQVDYPQPRRRAAREELAYGADPPGVGGTIDPFE